MLSNSQDIRLVRESFGLVELRQIEVGNTFYKWLFQLAPNLRHLFPAELSNQAETFAEMLGVIITSLDDERRFNQLLKKLGNQHASYGVVQVDYSIVGQALIKALEEALGDRWNAETESAWQSLYSDLVKQMLPAD